LISVSVTIFRQTGSTGANSLQQEICDGPEKGEQLMKAAGSLLACLLLIMSYADDHDVAKRLKDTGDIVPLATILKTVSTTHPGRVLEVQLQHQHGRPVYHVELVDAHGVVWYLQFDATQGALLHKDKEKGQ
jgi:uncharacterized membrane protein YkoI